MDLVSILLIALAGALALYFLGPKATPPQPVVAASDLPKPKPKPKKGKGKGKGKRQSKPVEEPKPEPEPVPAETKTESEPKKTAKKPSKKARQRAALRATKAAKKEAERQAELERAKAAKAAKKKAKKAAKARAKEKESSSAGKSKSSAATAAASKAPVDEPTILDSPSYEDDDAGEWNDTSEIRRRKKKASPKRADSAGGSRGPVVKKTIDVGRQIPALMGKKGANIKAIREASGADINVPRREDNSTVVTVTGTASAVAKALVLIQERIEGGSPRAQDDRDAETIPIQENDVRLVIGRGGSNIKLIQKESGASLDILKEGPPTVTIRGDQDQIASAKTLIAKVIEGRGLLNGVRETLPLEEGQRRIIVGPKGVTVNGIRDQTNAELKISNTQVDIYGTPEQVKAAAAAIRTVLRNYITETMTVDGRKCASIIGHGGSVVSKLQADSGAEIKVNNATKTVTISGSAQAVTRARADITAIVEAPLTFAPLADGVSSETLELGDFVSRVIGRRGETMQKIAADTGANLDFIEQTCRISGTAEQVVAGQEAVQKIVEDAKKRAEKQKRAQEEREARAAAAAAAAATAGDEDDANAPEEAADEDALGDDDLLDAAGW